MRQSLTMHYPCLQMFVQGYTGNYHYQVMATLNAALYRSVVRAPATASQFPKAGDQSHLPVTQYCASSVRRSELPCTAVG